MSFTHFGLEFEKSTENTVCKIVMCVRSFSAAMLTILFVLISFSYSCLGQADEKPVYKFEDTRISQADTLLARKQYAEALKAYQQTLDTYNKESFYEGMVYATERMAFCHRRLGDDKLSAATFQKAIELAKEKLEPNHMLLSKAYLNNGIRAHYNDNTMVATLLLDSAMWTYQKSSNKLFSNYKGIVRFKFYTQYYSLISQDSLIKYVYEKKRIFDYKQNDINKEIYMITDFGRAFYRIGDYEKSVAYCLEAIKKSRQHLETLEPFYHSDAMFTLGRSLLVLGKPINALDVSNDLIDYTRRENPESNELSGYLNLKAVTLVNLRRHEEARRVYFEIRNRRRKPTDSENFHLDVTMNLGISYVKDGNQKTGLPYLLEALESQKKIGNTPDLMLATRYRYVADSYVLNSEFDNAVKHYDSALRILLPSYKESILRFPSHIPQNLSLAKLKFLKYKVQSLKGIQSHDSLPNSALLYSILEHTQAIQKYLIDNRERIESENDKLALVENFKQIFESGIQVIFELHSQNGDSNYVSDVCSNMARSKSLLFLEQQDDYSFLLKSNFPGKLRENFSIAKVTVDSLDNLINQQIAIDPLGDSVMMLNTEKMKWNARLAEVRETIEKEYPDADNDLLSKDVTINSLRADHQLTDQKALVEYFVGDSVVFVVGLSGEKESFHRIKKDKKLNQALSNFLGEVNTTPHSGELNEHLKNFGESAATLYRELLQPVLDDLGEISEMIIVPDDILSRVPFEMLVSEWSGKESSFKELNYLLRNVKVSHLLSSKVSFNELTETHGKGMLGFGYAGEGIVDERAEMGGLPGALKEINFLKSNFEGDYYMGKEGTKHQFLKKAGDYDVIHLALHGKSDSVNRYNSALVFNGDRDYYMTSTDLYRTRLKSKLAVLSACETGIGKISEGEGSFSIARGFAIAGVPAIVTTLWKVNDEAGATITEQFYRNLQAGDKKDEALRQAKLKYLEESDNLTSSPFYWGSYILIGDTSTIELKGKAGLPWQWALITLVLLASMGLGLRRLSRKPFDQAA